MSWTFEALQRSSAGTPSSIASGQFSASCRMVWTGSRTWMATGTTVKVFNHWAEEYLDQAYYFDTHLYTLPYETIDTSAEHTTPQDMCVWYDHVYILEGTKITWWNKETFAYIGQTTVPASCFPRFCAANGKLWLTSQGIVSADRQAVHIYDIAGNTWSTTLIPGKKQVEMRDIIDGFDGKVVITAFNEHAIKRFDTVTNAYVDTHRVNRHPYRLAANQNKDVFAMSSDGMVSKLTQPGLVTSNVCGTLTTVDSMYEDGSYYWFTGLGTKLLRVDKSTQDAKTVNGPNPGSDIIFTKYNHLGTVSDAVSKGVMAPSFFYEQWNGTGFDTITIKPYMIYYSSAYTYAARLTALCRVNSVQVLGTAMISIGEQDYYGTVT